MTEIYYIEDDDNIAQAVKQYLQMKNYVVFTFSTIADAKAALQKHLPRLLLVDWNMPDGEGDMLCRWIRHRWRELPVIFLTVRDDSRDIVAGFNCGADDYVVKPFELEVLLSRIQALLRRTQNLSENYLSCGDIYIDQDRMIVYCCGEEVCLSQTEYQLLLLLMRNKGKTVTRERLLNQIWDNKGDFVNDNTLTVTMKRLREKLNHPSCIKTIRSFGYRMEDGI